MIENRYSNKAFLFLCAVAILFSLAGCKKKPQSPEDETKIISEEGSVVESKDEVLIELGVYVGPVRFGMSKEEVINLLGQPDKLEEPMQDMITLDYISSRGLLLAITPSVGVNYLKCFSNEYPGYSNVTTYAEKTTKGVSMGAGRDQIVAAYGQPDRTASKGDLTILYYDNLASEMIITNDRLVGIKMIKISL